MASPGGVAAAPGLLHGHLVPGGRGPLLGGFLAAPAPGGAGWAVSSSPRARELGLWRRGGVGAGPG
eukprot:2767492-Alexandrium_andersonii.AAC.1